MYRGSAHKVMVGRPEGNRPLGRPRCSWEDNIKMGLGEMAWKGVDLTNFRPVSSSERTRLHEVS